MPLLFLADILSPSSPIYAILVLGGLFVGAYAKAARMPRLLIVCIAMVMVGTLLLMVAAQSADQFTGYR